MDSQTNAQKRALRRILGLACLSCTILLWTTSSFLASWMFADDTYSKPFFVTYVNSSFFILPLVPLVIRKLYESPEELQSLKELVPGGVAMGRNSYAGYEVVKGNDEDAGEELWRCTGWMEEL